MDNKVKMVTQALTAVVAHAKKDAEYRKTLLRDATPLVQQEFLRLGQKDFNRAIHFKATLNEADPEQIDLAIYQTGAESKQLSEHDLAGITGGIIPIVVGAAIVAGVLTTSVAIKVASSIFGSTR